VGRGQSSVGCFVGIQFLRNGQRKHAVRDALAFTWRNGNPDDFRRFLDCSGLAPVLFLGACSRIAWTAGLRGTANIVCGGLRSNNDKITALPGMEWVRAAS
jgi:hypothetical protein